MTTLIIILMLLVGCAVLLGVFITEVHFKNVAKSVTLDEKGVELYSIGGGKWGTILIESFFTILTMLILIAEAYDYSQRVARDIDAGKYERVVKTTTTTQGGQMVKTDSTITFIKKKP